MLYDLTFYQFWRLPTHDEHFKQHFPALDLVTILALLSKPEPYFVNAVTPRENRTMSLEAITYLLRRDLVVQLHAYFLVKIPQYIKLGYTREEFEKLRNSGDHGLMFGPDDTSIISPFERASDSEREWLRKFVANQNNEIVSLFDRFVKILNFVISIFLVY